MRTALAIVLLLLLTGLVQHPQPTELADEITVYSTDNYDPVADMTLGANQDISENIVHIGTKNVAGQDWDVHRLILDVNGQLNVEFDASNSSDPDATAGNGIVTYEWKIFFDAPYGDDQFNLEGHTFEESASSNGLFTYSFQNVTVDESGTSESQIRMELRVYDTVGKVSEKFRMYFVVADEGSVDQEPVFQFDASNNMTLTDSDVFYINGTLVSGSETGEVFVEAAFSMDDFNESAIVKYNLMLEGLFNRAASLSDGDTFSMTLSINGLYTNLSETIHVYIKTYERDDQRWVTYHWFEITLMACQGLVAPEDAISAGGEFILDSDGECQWDGAWTYDSQTGHWEAPAPEVSIDFEPTSVQNNISPTTNHFLINGTISSTTVEEVFIEVTFDDIYLNTSDSVTEYALNLGLWNGSAGLSEGETFSLGLMLDPIRGDVTFSQTVYISAYATTANNTILSLETITFSIPVINFPDLENNSNETEENPTNPQLPPVVTINISDYVSHCDGWESFTVEQINQLINGSDCPEAEDSAFVEDDESGEESVPGFEAWLLILAMLFAVSFRRKLNV
ncbi:MAG: Uncharacterised protein [Candidatus Poseidoniaceae archaeon]|nr:MAG: Uncharacterised protein [Candidatus Poseidoniaceae archaeon]